jgi:hypothetical protein
LEQRAGLRAVQVQFVNPPNHERNSRITGRNASGPSASMAVRTSGQTAAQGGGDAAPGMFREQVRKSVRRGGFGHIGVGDRITGRVGLRRRQGGPPGGDPAPRALDIVPRWNIKGICTAAVIIMHDRHLPLRRLLCINAAVPLT